MSGDDCSSSGEPRVAVRTFSYSEIKVSRYYKYVYLEKIAPALRYVWPVNLNTIKRKQYYGRFLTAPLRPYTKMKVSSIVIDIEATNENSEYRYINMFA